MLIYFFLYGIIAFSFLFGYTHYDDKKKISRNVGMVAFGLLIILLSLRHPTMGVDLGHQNTVGYLPSFEVIAKLPWKTIFTMDGFKNYEAGYIVLNKLIGSIAIDRQFFLFCMAILSLVPIMYTVYKRSESPLFSFIIFMGLPLIQMFFSGMRQIIAIAICTMALRFIEDKKIIYFIACVLFATLFHYSAIIFLIAYPVFHFKATLQSRIFSFLLLPFIYIFRTPLFLVLSRVLKDEAAPDNNGAVALMLLFLAIYLFCVVFTNYSKQQTGYINLFYIACICQMFSGIYSTAMRAGYYFMIAAIFALPSIVAGLQNDNTRRVCRLAIGCGFILFSFSLLSSDSFAASNPYYFFWENRF